jgi:hypothetical protein
MPVPPPAFGSLEKPVDVRGKLAHGAEAEEGAEAVARDSLVIEIEPLNAKR